MIAYADFVESRFMGFFARRTGTIPIQPEDRRSVSQAIRTARDAIRNGELVCIFPEGGLTQSGQMQPFHPGFLTILKHARRPLVPIYLGGFWGSIFSSRGERFFWKLPRRLPYPGVDHVRPADGRRARRRSRSARPSSNWGPTPWSNSDRTR